jgi:endonuclease/exonuclease/phosphatase family metal-dependent hydrolase
MADIDRPRDKAYRVVTYNIRHARGRDWRVSTARIADVLRPLAADIVALQEVDRGRQRSGSEDQAAVLAEALGMQGHFHPAMRPRDGLYGDAVLVRQPARLVRSGNLPSPGHVEPRGALHVEIALGGVPLQVIATHLGVRRAGRLAQIEGLLGPDWLGAALARGPTLLSGDFNSLPGSRVYGRIRAHLRDPAAFPDLPPAPATFPSRWPLLRLDHVFAGPGIRIIAAAAPRTGPARIASDHLPLVVDFCLEASSLSDPARQPPVEATAVPAR